MTDRRQGTDSARDLRKLRDADVKRLDRLTRMTAQQDAATVAANTAHTISASESSGCDTASSTDCSF